MNTPIPSPESHALIVEGTDDFHVATHIWRRHANADMSRHISVKGGIANILPAIEGEIKMPGRRALGIIVDADDDLSARWQAVAGRLADEGIQTPNSPDPDGTIINAEGYPRVGIWLMPDNASAGELEDFISEMIPDGDPVWPLSAHYIDGIPAPHRKFAANKETRAKVHAWLAARENPRPMGQAIRARDLEIGGPLCQSFIRWLDNLMR